MKNMQSLIASCALTAAAALGLGGVAVAQTSNLAGIVPVTVTLKLHNQGELQQLVRQQSNPASPLYGHFLTVNQFRASFAPTPGEYESTVRALRALGFSIRGTSQNRTVIGASAPAVVVMRTFKSAPTAVRTVGGVRYASVMRPANAASLPSVEGMLDNQGAQVVTNSAFAKRRRGLTSAFVPVGPDGGFSPSALKIGFDFPSEHGLKGTGVNVADVIDGAPLDANIAKFLKQFGIVRTGPTVTTIVPVNGGGGFDEGQAEIDLEWIAATAPGATLYDYEVPFLSNGNIVSAYTQVVSDNKADIVNTSFAACEVLNPNLTLAVVPIFLQGASQGIAFENVTFGGAACGGIAGVLSPQTPSDVADALSVGGSNVIEDSSGKVTGQTGTPSGGGGVSISVPIFPEQQLVAGTDPSGRNTPDLVLPAAINGSGPSLYTFGAPSGGFVFVNNAPMAGAMAGVQQKLGHRLGAFDRTLYVLFSNVGYGTIFSDVVVGCNGTNAGKPICAKPGYDITAGIGSADLYKASFKLH